MLTAATVMYLGDKADTGEDDYGVRRNHPDLGPAQSWYDGPEPTLSNRDAAAPLLKDLSERPG